MMRYRFLPILLVVVLARTLQAGEGASPPIEYGYPDQSVWTTQRDTGGQLQNPLLKLADVLFARVGIDWTSRAYPAKRLFRHLEEGVIPFTMLVRAPSLQECCLFSRRPVATTELRVYRALDTAPVNSREDLVGQRVITIRGYSYGKLGRFIRDPRNRVEIQEAQSHAAAFQLFERGRGDYVVDYSGPATEILSVQPIDGLTSNLYNKLDVYLVLNKSYPDAVNLMVQLEKVVDSLDVPAILAGG